MATAGLAEKQEESGDSECGCCKPRSFWLLTGGLDFSNAYFHRGYLLQDDTLILEPLATVAFQWGANDAIQLTPYFTAWSSLSLGGGSRRKFVHGGTGECDHANDRTVTHSFNDDLAEFMLGTVLTYGDLSLDLKYTVYTHSTVALAPVQELGAKISYDVAGYWSEAESPRTFGVRPSFAVFREVSDSEGTEDTYAEVGFEPFWQLDLCDTKIGLSFPARLGMSFDGFYHDDDGSNERLGYFGFSARASIPLPIQRFGGSWFLTGSLEYLHLIADSAVAANRGDADDLVARIGLSFSY